MKAYIVYLIAALAFYVGGILSTSSGNAALGCALVALGCTCFAIALARRKKDK